LPLMYLVMFLPLLFAGAGSFSIDHWIAGKWCGFETRNNV
jgi:uncharacterized membrane protein YphA (DoxX/SURF4 family)